MRDNINKVADRGARLDTLQDKTGMYSRTSLKRVRRCLYPSTDNLAQSAQGFRRGANRVRKQMWWKDMKMRMCIVIGIILLLVVIIVPIVVTSVPGPAAIFFELLANVFLQENLNQPNTFAMRLEVSGKGGPGTRLLGSPPRGPILYYGFGQGWMDG